MVRQGTNIIVNFKEHQTPRKLRGGYYTPPELTDFLCRWVARIRPTSLLEPSCGDGAFFDSISRHLNDPSLVAFEIDDGEAAQARQKASTYALTRTTVEIEDFLGWASEALLDKNVAFDAIVGNPPFIRYQYLPSLFQQRAEFVFRTLDCRFTRHTNAWVPFVLASLALLRPGGRLGLVVPAEIIHVMHAQSLRTYLARHCQRVVIVDPQELWFPDTLQGAVLLLAEKRRGSWDHIEGVGIHTVRGMEFVNDDPDRLFYGVQTCNGRTIQGKWTTALMEPHMRTLLDALAENDSVRRFEQIADVDVGIVTGANKFFLVPDETIHTYGLQQWAHPMFGRSEHCPGVIYDDWQHKQNAARGSATNFLWFPDSEIERHSGALAYVRQGERNGLHARYKCRIRKPWYSVPSVYSTEIGMLKRAHNTPRLILNSLGAYTTDTAYRVRAKGGSSKQLVYCFVNALTALTAELVGRHYGGGVLELVPSEIENLWIPCPARVEVDLDLLDRIIRNSAIESVLEQQSRHVLGAIGLRTYEQDELLSSWKRLRDRRHRNTSGDRDCTPSLFPT